MGRDDDGLRVTDMGCHRVHDRLVAVGGKREYQYVVVPRELLRAVRQTRAERSIDCSVRGELPTAGERRGALARRRPEHGVVTVVMQQRRRAHGNGTRAGNADLRLVRHPNLLSPANAGVGPSARPLLSPGNLSRAHGAREPRANNPAPTKTCPRVTHDEEGSCHPRRRDRGSGPACARPPNRSRSRPNRPVAIGTAGEVIGRPAASVPMADLISRSTHPTVPCREVRHQVQVCPGLKGTGDGEQQFVA